MAITWEALQKCWLQGPTPKDFALIALQGNFSKEVPVQHFIEVYGACRNVHCPKYTAQWVFTKRRHLGNHHPAQESEGQDRLRSSPAPRPQLTPPPAHPAPAHPAPAHPAPHS